MTLDKLNEERKNYIKKLKETLEKMEDDNFDSLKNKKSILKSANFYMQQIIRATEYIEEEK